MSYRAPGGVSQWPGGGRQEPGEGPGQSLYGGSHGKGRVNHSGLASLYNSSRLCGIGTVPGCLVPGPGMM